MPLEINPTTPEAAWDGVAARAAQWTAERGIVLRDAVLLLPFTQLLQPARRAFGRRGGWQPRIETTRTLAASLGPAAQALPGQLTFDAGADRLSAQRMLRDQTLGAAWWRADPLGFERGVGALVVTAQAMAQAAAAVPPHAREQHWAEARQRLMPIAGLGERQRWLARIALEWAAQAPEPATDRLFALAPAAWIAVQAGGADALVAALMHAAVPPSACLVIDADAPVAATLPPAAPSVAVCNGFEDEAQSAAAQVLVHLELGEHPVALVGQDRLLVRRVRALLERQQVPLADETGWALSTTRAAAQVMLLLRAAAPGAVSDALFDWLKTLPAWPGHAHLAADIRRLERHCRRHAIGRVEDLDRAELEGENASFRAALQTELDKLRETRQPIARWLERLASALTGCGAWTALQDDEAGRSVLAALRLSVPSAWVDMAGASPLSQHEFTAWVDAVLEQSSFLPTGPAGEAKVVITPLARVMLRPFAAVVCPGADDRHLGARPAPHPLLAETELQQLALPTAELRQQREALAFAQALRFARVTFLRRRADGPEPLADSPLLQRLALDLGRARRAFTPWVDPRVRIERPRQPTERPAPAAAALLPTQLSASGAEALRDCPYRFFARHLLTLREDDELESDLEKRDYGTWLHAVLNEFHATRAAPESAPAEQARLREVAMAAQARLGMADDELLPFAASFAALVPRYIAWLHQRDADGATWQAGEQKRSARPVVLGGIELNGIIDRIDRYGSAGPVELIDYKTGSAEALKRKVAEPLEDTQLAFYAALEAPHAGGAPLQAIYLALDGSKRIESIEHPNVARDAAILVRELGGEFDRLRAGEGLPALGEPPVCDHCEARGLCRRDHWQQGGG